MTKQALGKGFEGLIPVDFNLESVVDPGEQIKQMPLVKIIANPDQPRREFDEQALAELAASIKEHGIIQPLVVTPTAGEKYRIVAGERRMRASKIAGLSSVPVIVRNHKELEELEIALVENVQRVDLSPLEQALSIIRLRDQFSLTPKEIAKKLGKAETTVSNIVRLLQLPKAAVNALKKQEISEGHARAILALKADEKLQLELLKQIKSKKMSVREAEQFVRESRSKLLNEQQNSSESTEINQKISSLQGAGYRLKLSHKKSGGSVTITFSSDDELLKILSKL